MYISKQPFSTAVNLQHLRNSYLVLKYRDWYHRSNDTYKDKFRWSDTLFQDNWVSPCSDF